MIFVRERFWMAAVTINMLVNALLIKRLQDDRDTHTWKIWKLENDQIQNRSRST